VDPDKPLAMRRATQIGEEVAFGECDVVNLVAGRRDARGHKRPTAQSGGSARGRQAGAGTGGALELIRTHGLKSRMCEPQELIKKIKHFAQAQRRRAQTEARVAIFKNEFLGRPMRSVPRALSTRKKSMLRGLGRFIVTTAWGAKNLSQSQSVNMDNR
jgi:hypothetical protein